MYRPRVLFLKSPSEITRELSKIGVDPRGVEKLLPKGVVRVIRVEKLPSPAAHILKQTMLSIGGDVAVSYESLTMREATTDALILGTETHYRRLIESLKAQPLNLKQLSTEIEKALLFSTQRRFRFCFGDHFLEVGDRTLIMGIVNITPDSFSDGGDYLDPDKAAERCLQLVGEGADLIDLGGESSRPGSEGVGEEEELRRVMPVLERVSGEMDVPVSIDTVKPRVAREALAAGADIVNDISGLREEEMVSVAAECNAGVIIMHMKGTPRTMQNDPRYDDLMTEIIDFLEERMAFATSRGVATENVLVDPGIGFGKSAEDNYRIIDRVAELRCLGRPIVVGPSRKAFLGSVVGADPKGRVFGTAAAVTWCIANGVDVVRVHDVAEMKQVAAIADEFMGIRSGSRGAAAGKE
jgi:dihydropteroate synthase